MTHDGLQKAVNQFNGSKAALARALDVSPMTVTQWFKRGVPAKRAKQIADACQNQVTKHELRPDIFDPEPESSAA